MELMYPTDALVELGRPHIPSKFTGGKGQVASAERQLFEERLSERIATLGLFAELSHRRIHDGASLTDPGPALRVALRCRDTRESLDDPKRAFRVPSFMAELIVTERERLALNHDLIVRFVCLIHRARTTSPVLNPVHLSPSLAAQERSRARACEGVFGGSVLAPLHAARIRQMLFFPDKRLIQYDCGKLQALAELLRTLRAGQHRALIFTQMTRMLDIFEEFLSLHGFTYLRMDGSTGPAQRMVLMERFNHDKRIFIFILSTRSGGVGVNLTGADTVIFYDSDWNPAMDAQAQVSNI